MMLVGVGAVIGAGTSLWASPFIAALLFNLKPRDALTFVGAVVVGGLAGGVASIASRPRHLRCGTSRGTPTTLRNRV